MTNYTVFNDITGKRGEVHEGTIEDMIPLLTDHTITEDRREVKLFSGATFKGPRKNENIIKHDFLVLDVDGDARMDDVIADIRSKPVNYVAYTSFSHRPELDRFRVVLPLDSYTPEQFIKSRPRFKQLFPYADPASFTPSQAFYLPCVHPECIRHFRSDWRWDDAYADNKMFYVEPVAQTYEPVSGDINRADVIEALKGLHPLAIQYDDWIKVGMGLANTYGQAEGLKLWLTWNSVAMDPREDEVSLTRKFYSFKPKAGGITAASIFYINNQYKR